MTLRKILYIEDNAQARTLITRLLGREYIVLEASNPLDGIELARETQPDLVLLDINMPHMSGNEVATRLRSLIPTVPLVAITADTSPGARERALAAGFSGYLTKPVDIDTLPDQILAFLGGKKETLPDEARHKQAYTEELVARLEEQVRRVTKIADRNAFLNEQNERMIALLQRRQRMLEASARVGHNITSILNLDRLLNTTVDIICEEFNYYYAGVFLNDENDAWAVLRAGHGQAGEKMLARGHKLKIDDLSMVGWAIKHHQARIALNVGEEAVHFKNPYLPDTRSEMALPLLVNDRPLGALTVQSEETNAFSDDDLTALQSLADQVAIAINNANLLRDLQHANRELVRTKTFEAIATATGEAIHWVGNKAAPIPGSAERVREDLDDLLVMVRAVLALPTAERETHPFYEVLLDAFDAAELDGIDFANRATELQALKPSQLSMVGSIESILEDLSIIRDSANTILNIKEDLIGPARQQTQATVDILRMIQGTIAQMGLPNGVVTLDAEPNLQPVLGDFRQLDRVFLNLIKNAWEALKSTVEPHIEIKISEAGSQDLIVQVRDNGPGIPPEILDKIWVSFFTTKGGQGGTGLGLAACTQIISQSGGKIWVESEVGAGATFFVQLPLATTKSADHQNMPEEIKT